ncbi:olfactory receptor 5G29-like [Gastrophryne carolinensis]
MLALFFVDWNPECNRISFPECIIQLYCFLLLGGTEFYILTAMAYDRYNAICYPLLYTTIMNRRTCIKLIAGSYLVGTGDAVINTVLTFILPFCRSAEINSFFCDIPALLNLACADTKVNIAVMTAASGGVNIVSFILISFSYAKIVMAVLKIHSSGRKKTFSTCSSHLIVVILFYGSIFYMYMRPKSSYADEDKVISVVYTITTPFLNPFIYSLRNNEVKTAVKNICSKTFFNKC